MKPACPVSRPAAGRALLLLVAVALAPAAAQAGGRVYASAEAVQPLAVGSKVPAVGVTGVRGEPVQLAERLGEDGALLVFYRGGW